MGTAAELILPVFLALGLLTRPMHAALFRFQYHGRRVIPCIVGRKASTITGALGINDSYRRCMGRRTIFIG